MSLEIIQMTADYVRPVIRESMGQDWVMNGDDNKMYKDIITSYYGSPTNGAIIDSYARFVWGLGLNIEQNFLTNKEGRKISSDLVMFGEATIEVLPDGTLKHADKSKTLPSKAIDGVIKSWWYSFDWSDTRKYKPKEIPMFGYGTKRQSQIYLISHYQVGQFYFNNPSYISALPYCEMEIELANYYVNHIKNGLSFGHIINVNGGKPQDDTQLEDATNKIKRGLTGSNNAGKFLLSFNNNKDEETTVTALEVSNAHEQYQFLTEEAQSKICVSHKVVSGAILGISKSTGFSSNAEEIETAFNETYVNVIRPQQELIIDAIEEIKGIRNIDFRPLREFKKDVETVQMSKVIETDLVADALLELGEEVDDEFWECIDEQPMKGEPTFGEFELKMAKIFSSFPNVKSQQDTSLFKVRYSYAGDGEGEREFCNKMVKANKVFRKEDIELAGSKNVNVGFGAEGADKYNIWLYKGGVNCKHFWMRKIYLRRGNNSISVNDAKKRILALEPSERADAKWEVNDKLVAQPAQKSNNFFKLPK